MTEDRVVEIERGRYRPRRNPTTRTSRGSDSALKYTQNFLICQVFLSVRSLCGGHVMVRWD